MPASSKPSASTGWTASGGSIVEPSGTDKTNGLAAGYRVPASWINFIWSRTDAWLKYLNDAFPYANFGNIGSLLLSSAAEALTERFNIWAAAFGTSTRTCLWSSGLAGAASVACYVYTANNLGYTVEIAINAEFDGTVWNRVAGATNSTLLRFDQDGTVRWAWRDDGAANGWADSYAGSAGAGTGWTTITSASLFTTTLNNNLDLNGQIDVEGTATFQAQTTFQDNVRVNGTVGGSGGGTLTTTADLAVTGDLTTTEDIDATGSIHADANITCDGDVHAGDDMIVDGDSSIAGRVDAAAGLGYSPYRFLLNNFTGAGPSRMFLGHLSSETPVPAGGYLLRAKAGKLREMIVSFIADDGSQFQDVDGGITLRFRAGVAQFDTSGAETSTSYLKTVDIGSGDHWNVTDGIDLDVDYAGSRALFVEVSTLGGSVTIGTPVCELQIQE